MVQVSKQAVQQWMLLDCMSKKNQYEEKITHFEKKYDKSYSEFEQYIETTDNEVFEEWDDYIDWGAYVKFLHDLNEKINEIKLGNIQMEG